MDFELFRKIIDEAGRYGPRSFSLHLFGEPLLYPRIFEAVRYIKKRNSRNTVLFTTNGILINDCIDDFLSCGITQAFWTWRREARFTESTLLKLRKWGKFRVRFIDGITPDSAREEWKDWGNTENRRMHDYASGIQTERFKIGSRKVVLKESKLRQACYHPFLAPAVAWNGKFLTCCSDPKQMEVFGDINKERVSECFQRLETLRQAHLRREFSGICKNCDVYKEVPDIFFSWQYKS